MIKYLCIFNRIKNNIVDKKYIFKDNKLLKLFHGGDYYMAKADPVKAKTESQKKGKAAKKKVKKVKFKKVKRLKRAVSKYTKKKKKAIKKGKAKRRR